MSQTGTVGYLSNVSEVPEDNPAAQLNALPNELMDLISDNFSHSDWLAFTRVSKKWRKDYYSKLFTDIQVATPKQLEALSMYMIYSLGYKWDATTLAKGRPTEPIDYWKLAGHAADTAQPEKFEMDSCTIFDVIKREARRFLQQEGGDWTTRWANLPPFTVHRVKSMNMTFIPDGSEAPGKCAAKMIQLLTSTWSIWYDSDLFMIFPPMNKQGSTGPAFLPARENDRKLVVERWTPYWPNTPKDTIAVHFPHITSLLVSVKAISKLSKPDGTTSPCKFHKLIPCVKQPKELIIDWDISKDEQTAHHLTQLTKFLLRCEGTRMEQTENAELTSLVHRGLPPRRWDREIEHYRFSDLFKDITVQTTMSDFISAFYPSSKSHGHCTDGRPELDRVIDYVVRKLKYHFEDGVKRPVSIVISQCDVEDCKNLERIRKGLKEKSYSEGIKKLELDYIPSQRT